MSKPFRTNSFLSAVVATVFGATLLAGAARCSPADRPVPADRPPATLKGSWSYSASESHDGSSRSESLSVRQSKADPRQAFVSVTEMVNGVTHSAHQDKVRYPDVSATLDRLVARAKRGL